MSNSPYDAHAENTFIRAMLNGVEFVSLYEHITPEMLYGHGFSDGNWYPVGVKHIYEAIRSLYPDIKSVPTREMLINRLRQRPMPVAGLSADLGITFLERLYTEPVPTSAEATDARIRVYKSYAFRYAGGLLTRAAEMMKHDEPDAVLSMLSRSSTIKADKTNDYDITNYVNTLAQRQDRLCSQARGDDPTVIRIPFGIRGLDIEVGGMQPGDLIIGALGAGRGKCFARGTRVLMSNGSCKNVEDVIVGDQLIGPDSKPRAVTSLARGREMMYRITPVKGDSYVVNESHILSLRMTCDKNEFKKDQIVNISVSDYISSTRTFKHHAKGWRTGVEFAEQAVDLDPYILGVWLGDGTSRNPEITTTDWEIKLACAVYGKRIDCEFIKDRTAKYRYRYTTRGRLGREKGGSYKRNKFFKRLDDLNLIMNKHIPDLYKFNCRQVRLDTLAGLIDTDGHLTTDGGVIDIIGKSRQLMDDVCFLARSVGLAAYVTKCNKECVNNGVWGIYYRVCISGDLSIIPTKVKRKQAMKRLQKKNVLNTGIKSVVPIGVDDYYGFNISGDRLFLLSDFTVVHNSIALNDSCAFNVDLGSTCVLFTKEMNAYEQGIRFDSRFTAIPHPRYFNAQLDLSEMQTWESKIKGLKGKLIIVTVKRNFTPQRVSEVLGNLDWEYDIRGVYLDYLNLMEPNDEKHRNKPEWEKGGILCEELKEVAQERMNPIMTMCQLKPQSMNKNRITYDDIAATKLAVAANANVVFAILADEWAKSVGKSYLQILKVRHRTPDKDCYDMFPQLDYIRIDSNVHNLPNHPAPVMPQMFKDLSLTAAKGEQKPQNLTVLDGNGQPISIKPSGDN